MAREFPTKHNDTHRPAGALGPSDPGGSDPLNSDWFGGGGGLPAFVLTGDQWFVDEDDSPIVLDADSGGSMDFYTTDDTTFGYDAETGRAQILRSGFYISGGQVFMNPSGSGSGTLNDDIYTYFLFKYEGDIGYSIEIPYLISGFVAGTLGEEVLGTRYVYAAGTSFNSDHDMTLQRIHPLSLTDATTFPLDYTPTFHTSIQAADGDIRVSFLSLWGIRVSDAFDAFHSD